MRKMTHIENFTILRKMLLFDYKCRNPLNQEARTCMIKKELYIQEGTGKMNFNDKKTKRIMAIIILIVIIAMAATTIIPYMMG